MKDGLVITKMRSSKQVEGYTKIESLGNEGKRKGVTLYFGNRGSSAFVRFYDKLAELGIGAEVEGGKKMFMPCPDRNKGGAFISD